MFNAVRIILFELLTRSSAMLFFVSNKTIENDDISICFQDDSSAFLPFA